MSLATLPIETLPIISDVRAELSSHRPYLMVVARAIVGNGSDADDLVQETCRRALEHEDQFIPHTNLRAWLTSILRNAHRDRFRRAAFEVLSPLVGEILGPEHELAGSDATDVPLWRWVSDGDLAAALRALPPLYRQVYTLREAGCDYEDIGRKLGISVKTVATRIHRARLWLRRELTARAAS
ncbi:MAG TPA: RNA polymerase sigma factor [Polyangia bacterium]|nr:RNA polymerase sigma factor [Polyangia bacterium]